MKQCPNCRLANADQNPQCVGCGYRWANVVPPILGAAPRQPLTPRQLKDRFITGVVVACALVVVGLELREQKNRAIEEAKEAESRSRKQEATYEAYMQRQSSDRKPSWWQTDQNGLLEDGTMYLLHGQLQYYFDGWDGRTIRYRLRNQSDTESIDNVYVEFNLLDSSGAKVGFTNDFAGDLQPKMLYKGKCSTLFEPEARTCKLADISYR